MHENLLKQLIRDEGTVRREDGRHKVYTCPAGYKTIGIGHNLEANPIPGITVAELERNGMGDEMAYDLLRDDVRKVIEQIRGLPAYRALNRDEVREAVLINMAFNMGAGALKKFHHTLRLIEDGDYAGAAVEMLNSRWADQVGNRATRLSWQMEMGEWQMEGC